MRGKRKRTLKGYDRCKARTVKGRQCRNRAAVELLTQGLARVCVWHWKAAVGL